MNTDVKIIVGLGNPGRQFHYTRHNIGFLIVDALVDKYGASWHAKGSVEYAEIVIHDKKIMLIKPQTFINNSGKVLPALLKHGITIHNVLVVHDELEKPFGVVDVKNGGSHRGHNGLRSIISLCGADFVRVRCGIGRPENKEDVADYVLSNFTEDKHAVEEEVQKAVKIIEDMV